MTVRSLSEHFKCLFTLLLLVAVWLLKISGRPLNLESARVIPLKLTKKHQTQLDREGS